MPKEVRRLRKRVFDENGIITRSQKAQSESKQAVIAQPAPKKRTAKDEQSVAKKSAKPASKRKPAQQKATAKEPTKIAPKRKPAPHKEAIPTPEPLPWLGGIDAPPYLPPKNPQATFLGLPAEVRT